MNIELDLEWLNSIHICPDDYVWLMSKYKKTKTYWSLPWSRVKMLQSLGYVKIIEADEDEFADYMDKMQGYRYVVILRKAFLNLVEGNFDQMFNELLATYPMKVGNPQNLRILHAVDPKAKSNKKSRDRYKKIVDGKPHVHRKIMKALDNQLKHQRLNLQYMQMLEVWINNATWEKWEGVEIEADEHRQTTVL